MKYIILSLAIFLAGCATSVPVKQEFPAVPAALLEDGCPELLLADENNQSFKDMLKIVVKNYSTYYQCSSKFQAWQEWYKTQKKIQKEANK